MAKRLSQTIRWDRISATAFDLAMAPLEQAALREIRAQLIPQAHGRVLELGAGTGVNAVHYRADRIHELVLSDRDDRRAVMQERAHQVNPPLAGRTSVAQVDATEIPFPDHSFDTVVATLLFCSVTHPHRGFAEIRRVLRPGGRYLFLEHVHPDRPVAGRVFAAVNPVWRWVSRGCNLTRHTTHALRSAGFTLELGGTGDHGVFRWGTARVSSATSDQD